MGLIQFALAGNYKRFMIELKTLSKTVKKSVLLLFLDMTVSTVATGSGLSDYLNYRFYEKKFSERFKYATIGYQARLYKKICNIKHADFFSNKINFHKNFSKFTKRNYFDPLQGEKNLEKFLLHNPWFVIKPVVGLGGTNIRQSCASNISDKKKFLEKLRKENLFLEEKIKQHKDWASLSPNSINTIRAMTRIVSGKAELFFAIARIGSGKSIVDNFHQGGMAVLVDIETGRLKGKAIKKSAKEYEKSPVSGILFDGFLIPHFKKIEPMVLEAAEINKKVAVVGWDIAITPDGPIIIEGNRGPGFDIVQMVLRKGAKHMLKEINPREFK